MPLEIRLVSSLRDVPADAWNACFPGVLEDHAYLLAVEEAGMEGFAFRYILAQEDGRIVAAMPGFLTDYSLDTTLEGKPKKIVSALRGLFPNALTLKLACLGSPDTEYGLAGFHPGIEALRRSALLDGMMAHFERSAMEMGHRLIGVKDVPEFDLALWREILDRRQYRGIPGLPVATLPIRFFTMDEYFSALSGETRKDMRRKLKASAEVRIEWRENIDDVIDDVMALYRETRERAAMQFEELTPRFFQQALRTMPGRAVFALYFEGDRLLAANFLLHDGSTLLDKFFCMDGVRGRALNLYFLSWFTNVAYCLEHGLSRYQSGQAAYENKKRLRSEMIRTTMFFRHQNRLLHGALRLVAPFLAADTIQEAA